MAVLDGETGIGGYRVNTNKEIVWAKMDTLFPLPDDEEVTKRYIDYVTMDVNRARSLVNTK